MSSGARVGLQTYEETRSEIERLRAEHEARLRALDPQQSGRDAETVYRDASGRKVDMGVKKAEEKRARQEEMERQEKMMEWGKGLVQRREKEEQERREKEEGAKPLARYADDKEINEDLKNRDRWNDPAAAFLTVGCDWLIDWIASFVELQICSCLMVYWANQSYFFS